MVAHGCSSLIVLVLALAALGLQVTAQERKKKEDTPVNGTISVPILARDTEQVAVPELVGDITSINQRMKNNKNKSCVKKCKKSCNHGCESPNKDCSSPWVSIENAGCFRFVSDREEWDDARSYCKKNEGDLAILDSDNKRKNVVEYMDRTGLRDGSTRWIGANDRSGSWRWLNKKSITSGWRTDAGEPDDDDKDDTCMYLYTGSYPSGRYTLLSDKECDDDKKFICEK